MGLTASLDLMKERDGLGKNKSILKESRLLSEAELEEEVKIATNNMVYNRDQVRRQLEDELYKEKEFMQLLPDEIQRKITNTMASQLERMKLEINQGTNLLRDNILNLRAKAIELDEERRRATHEVNKLRSHLSKIQYEDDIRTNELLGALAEDNLNRILPSSSRFNMPESLARDYEEYNFPISQYETVMGQGAKVYTNDYFENEQIGEEFYGQSKPKSGLREDFGEIEGIYNRNLQRGHVLQNTLEGHQGHYALEEYLDQDLAKGDNSNLKLYF